MSNTLNEFVGGVSNPEPGPVQLSTGLVRVVPGQLLNCYLKNVSPNAISPVTFRVFSSTSNQVAVLPSNDLPAHGSIHTSVIGIPGYFGCEFTFTGFAKDVRGTLIVTEYNRDTGVEGIAVVAVDAR
jgi:hypothetical protein